MAAHTDPDPWNWSVDDVQRAFQPDAVAQLIADLPHAKLPPFDQFLEVLRDNDVSGATLLTAVDHSFLREDCGCKSLGVRSAILHCISKLQARSRQLRTQQEPTGWETPTSTVKPAQLEEPQESATVEQDLEGLGGIARAGETQVEDQRGCKRRRLDLTGASSAEPATTQDAATSREEEDLLDSAAPGAYLRPAKQPIDTLFFGKAAVGSQLGALASSHPLFTQTKLGEESENYEYINLSLRHGSAGYASSQLRHFLVGRREEPLLRRGQDALAIYPYREGLQVRPTPRGGGESSNTPSYNRLGRLINYGERSVIVFQPPPGTQRHDVKTGDEGWVAVRESETLMSSGALELGYDAAKIAELIGDSEYLLSKYRSGDQDDLLPEFDEDVSSNDNEDPTNSVDDNGPRGDDEAEDEDESTLPAHEVQETVDSAIARYKENWQVNTLPRLESKEAWTVWRKTKESKAIRNDLVKSTNRMIERLEQRLSKLRADLERGDWESKESLLKQCEIIQVTVEDKEKQLWNVSVWQRRQRPAHTNKRRPAERPMPKQSGSEHRASGFQNALRAMGPDDRMSISPGSNEPPASHVDGNAALPNHDGERYFTPEDSPSPYVQDGPFVVPDEADEADESDQGSQQGAASSETEADGDGDAIMHDDEVLGPVPQQENPPTNGMMSTPDESANVKNEAFSGTQARNNGEPGALSPLHFKKAGANVVDLTFDSSSSAPKKNKAKRPKHEASGGDVNSRRSGRSGIVAVDNATASDVDAWDYDVLRDLNDRRRMLVKLLRDAGPKVRNDLHKCWQSWMKVKFVKQLSAAVKVLSGYVEAGRDLDSLMRDTMLACARLFYAFHLTNPDLVQMEELPEAVTKMASLGHMDVSNFVDQLRSLLLKADSKLFVKQKPTSSDDPYLVSSDPEEDKPDAAEIDLVTPPSGKKRRKKIVLSQTAKDTRTAAHDRVGRFISIQEQRFSNPSQLQEMVPSESSKAGTEINLARDDGDDPIYIYPPIAREMKPHQIEGVQFMWREITATDGGGKAQGCLLAHTMGLGKTMQSITLMLAVDEASRSRKESIYKQLPKCLQIRGHHKRHLRFLILSPAALLHNWRKEFIKWTFGKDLGNLVTTIETTTIKPGAQSYLTILEDWSHRGGILLLGYSIFRMLACPAKVDELSPEQASARRVLLDEAEIVVADEAHAMKNLKSGIAIATHKLRTESRIALTGTPMSNDVPEIYSMISWIAPNYLGDQSEFNRRFAIPIREGLYTESSRAEKSRSRTKLAVLHNEIEPKIHRADITVLKSSLKSKTEFVITVELTEPQRAAYSRFVYALTGNNRNREASQVTIFAWLGMLSLLTNHPHCYREKLLTPKPKGQKKIARGQGGDVLELPDDLIVPEAGATTPDTADTDDGVAGSLDGVPDIDEQDLFALGFTEKMVHDLLQDLREDIDPSLSAKARILCEILRLSERCGDRILVFSSSIPSLNYLGRMIDSLGIKYGRIDGGVDMKKRPALIADFDQHKFSVFLISTRAGGLGLNLPAANRVVIFDFGFNPAWEEQAIGRAYRLGQTKQVFVYRFLAGGTFETNIYNKQLFKTSLAQRVVDKKNPERHARRNVREYLYEPHSVDQTDVTVWEGKDPHVLDRIVHAQTIRPIKDQSINICVINTMETLQQEDLGEKLTEGELLEVQGEIAMGRRGIGSLQMHNISLGIPGVASMMGMGMPSSAPPAGAPSASAGRFSATQVGTAGSSANPFSHTHGPLRDSNFAPRDVRNIQTMGHPPSASSHPYGHAENRLGGLPYPPSTMRRD